jgi:hypothetical protein
MAIWRKYQSHPASRTVPPPLSLRPAVSVLTLLLVSSGMNGLIPVVHAAAPTGEKHDKPYALIFGTAWSPDNRPVYGVKVRIRRANQRKASWEVVSDHHGEFAQRVPAGKADYVVWADMKGFKSSDGSKLQAGPEVTVHVDNDERQDIGLHLIREK